MTNDKCRIEIIQAGVKLGETTLAKKDIIEASLKEVEYLVKQNFAILSDKEPTLIFNDGGVTVSENLKGDLNPRLRVFEKEKPKQYLDIGESEVGPYYGVITEGFDTIVFPRDFLRNTLRRWKKETIGENQIPFNYSSKLGDIARRWSGESIKEYILGKEVEPRNMFDTVFEKLDYYIHFGLNEDTPTVEACWTIATYFYPQFYWFPHLLLNGPSGSGKSKNAFVIKEMAFGGYDIGASAGATPAQIFRTLESNRGTIVIDEFERRDKSESQQLANQILNASADRDAYVIRNEKVNGKWASWKFPIFSPKIACNITGINPTSLSRFIPCHMLKTKTEHAKRKPHRKNARKELNAISDDLHILGLSYWNEVGKIYETIDLDLYGRDEDNWLPICTIAKWMGNDILKKVERFIEENKEIEVDTNSIEADFFLTLLDVVSEEKKPYTAKQIAEKTSDVVDSLGHKCPDRWVGKTLNEYKFKPKHKSRGATYYLCKENVKKIVDLYFNPNLTSQTTLTSSSSSISQTSQKDDVYDLGDGTRIEKYPDGIPRKRPQIGGVI